MARLEKYLFYLFIFCVPFQTRVIWANWAPTRVGFNEWTSAFLQVTDIFIVTLLFLWAIRWLKGGNKIEFSRANIFLGIFFVISTLSITTSSFKSISTYQLLKLAELILFYFYIRSSLGKVFSRDRLLKAVVLTGFFQAIIAILQYTTQGALGLKIFGESPITPGGAGVASFYVGSMVYLRAYGTFPHPNILAVFLMLAIVGFYYLYFNCGKHFLHGMVAEAEMFLRTRVGQKCFRGAERLWNVIRFPFLIYAIMLYALLVTYSRTVIGLMALSIIVFLAFQIWENRGVRFLYNKRFITLALVSLITVSLFMGLNFHQAVSRIFISSTDEAVSLRIFYDKLAGQTTGHYPWLGVGVGAFVPKLMQTLSHIPSYYYQPVHNIYLLISAETGFFGIASFLLFLFFLTRNFVRNNNLKDPSKLGLLLVCLTLLMIGLFDHLLWTIQQGRIIFWLVLALL